jgi:hypothetical protein
MITQAVIISFVATIAFGEWFMRTHRGRRDRPVRGLTYDRAPGPPSAMLGKRRVSYATRS